MQRTAGPVNIPSTQLVRLQQRSPGAYTAEVVGLSEVQATAASAEEAVQQVREHLQRLLASGQFVVIELAESPSVPVPLPAPRDPNDSLEREFLQELVRFRQEDLERTLKEYEQGCSDSSSTPTT